MSTAPELPRPPLPTGFRSGPRVGVAGFFCEDPGGKSFRLRGRVVFRTGSGTGSGTHLLSPAVGAGDSAEAERRGGHWTSPMDSEFHPSSTCHELLPFHSLRPPPQAFTNVQSGLGRGAGQNPAARGPRLSRGRGWPPVPKCPSAAGLGTAGRTNRFGDLLGGSLRKCLPGASRP